MGYSIDPISADCYEGTTCLINKLGITDELMIATIQSANGVTDFLRVLFSKSIV